MKGLVGGWGWGLSRSKEGSARTPNTDSPLANDRQEGDTAQILSNQNKKMVRNRKRESCQLEDGLTLSQIHPCTPTERFMGIEDGGEKAKGKSTNTK